MTRATLLALASRVEAATGADRELDYLIAEATATSGAAPHYEGQRAIFAEPWSHPLYEGHFQSLRNHGYPRYTASLDAAMSLVPSGLSWTLGQNVHHKHWLASVNYLNSEGAPACAGDGCSNSTPALALTAACLRARAMLEQDNG